jgi:hypothetical protein
MAETRGLCQAVTWEAKLAWWTGWRWCFGDSPLVKRRDDQVTHMTALMQILVRPKQGRRRHQDIHLAVGVIKVPNNLVLRGVVVVRQDVRRAVSQEMDQPGHDPTRLSICQASLGPRLESGKREDFKLTVFDHGTQRYRTRNGLLVFSHPRSKSVVRVCIRYGQAGLGRIYLLGRSGCLYFFLFSNRFT